LENNGHIAASNGNHIFITKKWIKVDEPWEFIISKDGQKEKTYKFIFGDSKLYHISDKSDRHFSLIADHPNPSFNIIIKGDIWYLSFSPNRCVEVVFLD